MMGRLTGGQLPDRQQARRHCRCRRYARRPHRREPGRGCDAEGTRAERFDFRPNRPAADTAYGSAKTLRRRRDRGIEPHIPVWDKSTRNDGAFSRADFTFDAERDRYICPGGKTLKTTGRVHEGRTLFYLAREPKLLNAALPADH